MYCKIINFEDYKYKRIVEVLPLELINYLLTKRETLPNYLKNKVVGLDKEQYIIFVYDFSRYVAKRFMSVANDNLKALFAYFLEVTNIC